MGVLWDGASSWSLIRGPISEWRSGICLRNVPFPYPNGKGYDRGVKFGLAISLTDRTIGPAEVARLAEERGFESLFVSEHTHFPASVADQHPGATFPDAYTRTLDPVVALTAAAAVTERLRLGTAVMLVAQHEPLVTAKALASLDLFSGGRLEIGAGAGWLEGELANHGVAYGTRFGHLREHVAAMREIWREEVASFEGEHVRFDRVWSWPKPVQVGGPPVLIGGDGPKVLDRVLAWGDGWLPRAPGGLDELAPRVRELNERCDAAGRPRVPVTLYGAASDPASLEAYEELGVDRGLFKLPSAGAGDVERALDELVAAVQSPTVS